MILKCVMEEDFEKVFASASLGEAKYSVPYDIAPSGKFTKGYFVITDKYIASFEDEMKCVFSIAEIEKIRNAELVGAGRLEIKENSTWHVVCSYSSEYLAQYAMMERIIEEILSGDEQEHESFDESQVCPNCGRRFLRNTRVCPHCSDKMGMFKRLIKLSYPCKNLYALILALFWVNAIVQLVTPIVNKHMINDAITNPNGSIKSLMLFVALTALLNVAATAVTIARQLAAVRASNRLVRDLRHEIYSKLQNMAISKLEGKKTGDLMQRINQDTQRIGNFIQNVAVTAVNELILFLGVGIIIFFYNWKMALLILAPVPFALVIVAKVRNEVRRRYHTQWRKGDKMTSKLNDILNGMRVVKAFGREKGAIEEFSRVAAEVRDQSESNDKFSATVWPTVRFLIGFGSYFILLYGGSLVVNESLTLGELMQFSTYASYLYNRMMWFSNLPRRISEAATSAQRAFEVLDETPEAQSDEKLLTPEIEGKVEFKNVTFGYKSYRSVVKNFSLNVKKGEMIGLVGHSGAGKSTVINLLMRLYDIDDGQIRLDGEDLKKIDKPYYKHNLGVVLQESYLFSGSILSNICYSRPDATADDVIRAAKIANAHDFIMALPNGYDTYVGEKGYRLSGGERQRIAIARAVISEPKILILDEATASVDTETEAQIQEALSRLVKGRTTFAIAHRLSTLKNADRLVVLEEGRIAELGTHRELMEKDGIYASLVKAQRTMNALNFNADEGGRGGRMPGGRGGRPPGGPPPR